MERHPHYQTITMPLHCAEDRKAVQQVLAMLVEQGLGFAATVQQGGMTICLSGGY